MCIRIAIVDTAYIIYFNFSFFLIRLNCYYKAERVNNSVKKYPVNKNSTPGKYPVKRENNKPVGRTAQCIIDMVIANPMITREKMADELGISLDGVKKQIKNSVKEVFLCTKVLINPAIGALLLILKPNNKQCVHRTYVFSFVNVRTLLALAHSLASAKFLNP